MNINEAFRTIRELGYTYPAGIKVSDAEMEALGEREHWEEAMFVLARRFAKDESGTALEYGLTEAGISFGLIMAMDALDPELRTTLANVTSLAAPLHGAVSGFRSGVDSAPTQSGSAGFQKTRHNPEFGKKQ